MPQEDFTVHVGWLVASMAASGALLFILLSLRIAFYARERRAEAERRVAAEALRAAAENANRTKDLFLATLSHELRGPLSAVIGWTDVARSYLDDPRELERSAATRATASASSSARRRSARRTATAASSPATPPTCSTCRRRGRRWRCR